MFREAAGRVPVLCPGQVDSGGSRWGLGPKNLDISLVLGPHNAEVEGSSPSLTTKINWL